jgi:hypothetical protein
MPRQCIGRLPESTGNGFVRLALSFIDKLMPYSHKRSTTERMAMTYRLRLRALLFPGWPCMSRATRHVIVRMLCTRQGLHITLYKHGVGVAMSFVLLKKLACSSQHRLLQFYKCLGVLYVRSWTCLDSPGSVDIYASRAQQKSLRAESLCPQALQNRINLNVSLRLQLAVH